MRAAKLGLLSDGKSVKGSQYSLSGGFASGQVQLTYGQKEGTKLKLEDMSKQELIDLVKSYESRKKYGLVWETDKSREYVDFETNQIFPIMKEVVPLRIVEEINSKPNYLIEGDNFYALNILNFTHARKIDVIYIDPPYNTGNKDFKYNDSFVEREDTFRHSKWINFIYKRLRLAKELLHENGLVFISIDDNEFSQLTLIADAIFGEANRLGPIVWFYEGVNDNNAFIKKTHEYILVYQKSSGANLSKTVRDANVTLAEQIENSVVKNGPKNPKSKIILPAGFPCEIESGTIPKNKVNSLTAFDNYVIKDHKLQKPVEVESGWSSKTILLNFIENNFEPVTDSKGQLTKFRITSSGNINYIKERDQSYVLSVLRNLGTVAAAGAELKNKGVDFDYPKPVGLIKYLLQFHANKNAVVLDFFAGSGTTGEAVLQLNAEDEGDRKFILVTNNEDKICDQVTYPRLKKSILGFVNSKKQKFPGYGGNLFFFKVGFLRKSASSDEMKIRISDNCVDLLCFREGIFEEEIDSEQFKIFRNGNRILGIYNSFDYSELQTLKKILDAMEGKKKVYVFTFDNEGLNSNDFIGWDDIEIEPIPQKMLEVIGSSNAN